jgi:hypothetical protein
MVNSLMAPVMTRRRIWLACAVAIVTDTIQFFGGMLAMPGWVLNDVLDVLAMGLQTLILGFHPLFLPTFIVKAVPMVDMLPTWTGCTFLVIALRRKQEATVPPVAPPPVQPVSQDVIDI